MGQQLGVDLGQGVRDQQVGEGVFVTSRATVLSGYSGGLHMTTRPTKGWLRHASAWSPRAIAAMTWSAMIAPSSAAPDRTHSEHSWRVAPGKRGGLMPANTFVGQSSRDWPARVALGTSPSLGQDFPALSRMGLIRSPVAELQKSKLSPDRLLLCGKRSLLVYAGQRCDPSSETVDILANCRIKPRVLRSVRRSSATDAYEAAGACSRQSLSPGSLAA